MYILWYLLKKVLSGFKSGYQWAIKKPARAGLVSALVGAVVLVGLLSSSVLRADNVSFNSVRDCDSNAVVYCGAMTIPELITKYNNNLGTRNIYDYFSISGSDVRGISQYAKAGKVYKDGNVTVGGKVVATNARTAGRSYMAGSTKVTNGSTTFYVRNPSVSFRSNSIDAFVVMKNGVFSYAILASCGNPVSAHPVAPPKTHPAYQLVKTVKSGASGYVNDVSISYGKTVTFRVVVRSTGDAPITNLYVKDTLPSGLVYESGSLKRDGDSANATTFFGSQGIKIASLAPGKTVTFTFRATTNPKSQPDPCSNKKLTNKAHSEGSGLPAQNDTAIVNITCQKVNQPSYRIIKEVQKVGDSTWSKDITVPNGTKVMYRVIVESTGTAAVTDLVVGDKLPDGVHYQDNSLKRDGVVVTNDSNFFGDGINIGSLNPGKSTTFTFEATIGSTDANAECVEGQLNNIGNAVARSLSPISDNATVEEQCIKAPVYSCDLLAVSTPGGREIEAEVSYTALGGAVLNNISYDFGDGSQALVTDKTSASYTYAADGTFTVRATPSFTVDGKIVTADSANCAHVVTFQNNTPVPPVTPENPTNPEVPNTGPGSIIGLFTGTTMLGTLASRYWIARRQR